MNNAVEQSEQRMDASLGLTTNTVLALAAAAVALAGFYLGQTNVSWDDGKLFLVAAGLAFAASLVLGLVVAARRVAGGKTAVSSRTTGQLFYGQLATFGLGTVLAVIFLSVAFVF